MRGTIAMTPMNIASSLAMVNPFRVELGTSSTGINARMKL
jgi:hypothetical protein